MADPYTVLAIIAAYATAAFVKGMTGLGFSTTCLPLLVLSVGLKDAMALVILPSLASNVFVMWRTGEMRGALSLFWPLYLATLPGLALGLWLLSWVAGSLAATVLGAVLISYGIFGLAQPGFFLSVALRKPLAIPTGLLTGVVNGLTGSQVMPVLPYLMALRLTPDQFVATINWSFSFSSIVMAIGLVVLGIYGPQTLVLSLIGLVPVWTFVAMGAGLRRRFSADGFRMVVLGLLILLGLMLVI